MPADFFPKCAYDDFLIEAKLLYLNNYKMGNYIFSF